MNLQLIKTEKFNDLSCDFYSAEDDIWMTRKADRRGVRV